MLQLDQRFDKITEVMKQPSKICIVLFVHCNIQFIAKLLSDQISGPLSLSDSSRSLSLLSCSPELWQSPSLNSVMMSSFPEVLVQGLRIETLNHCRRCCLNHCHSLNLSNRDILTSFGDEYRCHKKGFAHSNDK